MHNEDLLILHRRLRRAFQKSSNSSIRFDEHRGIVWGYETREAGSPYHWDGLQRGTDSSWPEEVLFQYTLEGNGAYEENGELWPVRPGEGFTTLLPSAHRYYLPDDSRRWTFFWFIIRHPFVVERIQKLRQTEGAVQTWKPGSATLESGALFFEAACYGKIREVWTGEEMLFPWLLQMERELHHRRYPRDERERLLDETRRIARERLHRPPSATELADIHRQERTTFSRKFKAATGYTPAAFVTEVRLEEALKLLRSEAKLDEIAASTGFADANHFCKVFRQHFHSSPGSYRRLLLKR